jgi:Protein of unknown function (DUF3617)
MKLTMWAALAAVVLAAACSPKGGANTSAQQGATPAAPAAKPTSGPDVAISEADFPHAKAGYWEVKITGDNGVVDTHHSCSSGQPPKLKVGPYAKYCQFSFKRTFLGAIVGDSTCNFGKITGTTHIKAQGDFNTAYSTDASGTMTIPGHPPINFRSHTEARWVGPCPPGEKPEGGV